MQPLAALIRPLRLEDIDDVIQIHRRSFPDSRSTKLGNPFLRKLYRWYVSFHPALAFGADLDGRLAGFVAGSLGPSSQARFRYTLPEIGWGFISHPGLVFQPEMYEAWRNYLAGLLRKTHPIPTSKENDNTPRPVQLKAGLDSIAVSAEARGRDIGRRLVAAFEAGAIRCGADYLSLGVELDNIAARRLYESCGWELRSQNAAQKSAPASANYIKIVNRA